MELCKASAGADPESICRSRTGTGLQAFPPTPRFVPMHREKSWSCSAKVSRAVSRAGRADLQVVTPADRRTPVRVRGQLHHWGHPITGAEDVLPKDSASLPGRDRLHRERLRAGEADPPCQLCGGRVVFENAGELASLSSSATQPGRAGFCNERRPAGGARRAETGCVRGGRHGHLSFRMGRAR